MQTSDQVIAIIYEAIDEANEVRPKRDWIRKETTEQLVGGTAALDSLSLLNLVMSVEERANAKFGSSLDLAAVLALPPETSPLRSVAAFADYIQEAAGARR